jgi:UDP-N-acetylbacillosamine N-acetyltransferase
VLWGAGWHAATVVDILRLRNEDDIVGFLDDVNRERQGTAFCNLPILGGEEQLEHLHAKDVQHLILTIGDCQARLRLAPIVREQGYELVTAIHPRAVIADGVSIGAGTVIKAGSIVDVGVTIGENVILSAGALISHGCVLEDGSRVAPGAAIAGNVVIGRGTYVGAGATIIEGIRIGRHSLIGAGAVVVRDIPDGVVAYGVPARVVRRVNE